MVLRENDIPSNIDLPTSSVAIEEMEGKMSEEEDVLSSSSVLEASQGTTSELANPVDDSRDSGMASDIVLENMDQPQQSQATDADNEMTGAPEKSESEVKAGVASPSCDMVPESENKDLPPCSSKQEGESIKGSPEGGSHGSPVRPEETRESQVD